MNDSKKLKCRVYAFVTVCMIVITLLSSGIGTFADESIGSVVTYPFTAINLPSTMLQRTSLEDNAPFIFGSQYSGDVFTHLETVYNWWLSDGATMSVRDGQFKWYGEYFILKGDSNNWNGGYIASVPTGSFFVGYYDYSNNPTYAQYRLYVPKEFIDDNNITKFPVWWSPSMLGTDKYSQFESPNDRTVNVSDASALTTIDGDQYYYFSNINTQANNFILQTSLPVYIRDNYNFDQISDLGSNANPNYSGGSGSSEDSSNNLVLDSADFTFSNSSFVAPYNSSFNTGSIYPNGNISFSFLPNVYQRDNSSDFTLTFGFTFDYDVTYKNWSNSDYGPFLQTSSLLNNSKSYSSHLYYSNQGVEFIDVPLSEFISNGNNKSFTFEDILRNMTASYNYETLLLNSKELDSVTYNKFNLNCTVFVSSGNDSSGNYSEWYNPMNKKGYTTDQSAKVNKNPYTSSDSTDYDSSSNDLSAPGTAGSNGDNSNNVGGGSGSGGSGSSTSSTGNITINNNPVNNVTTNGGSGSGGSGSGGSDLSSPENASVFNFYNTFNPFKLIFNALLPDTDSIADSTADKLGNNSFITLLTETFTFIPVELWSSITWYITASLTILIIALVIRVILDLL